jgi:hypothetical protein
LLGTEYTIGDSNAVEILTADIVGGNSRVYRVFADSPASEDIGVVTFNQATRIGLIIGSFTLFVEATNPSLNPNVVPNIGFEGCRDWAGLTGTGAGLVGLQALITRDLTGPVTAGNVLRIDAGRNIEGDISKDSSGLPTNDPIVAIRSSGGSISGDITAAQGNIRLVRAGDNRNHDISGNVRALGVEAVIEAVTGQDLTGDIEAPSGRIGNVFATGMIGAPSAPVSILAGQVRSDPGSGDGVRNIEFVLSQSAMHAHIDASPTPTTFGACGRVIADALIGADGNGVDNPLIPQLFTGSLRAHQLLGLDSTGVSKISALGVGCLDADVVVYDRVRTYTGTQDYEAGSRFIVGRSWENAVGVNGDEPLDLAGPLASSFRGQVIIGASFDGTSGTQQTWTDDVGVGINSGVEVLIGPTRAQPNQAPYYDRSSTTMGGGAIGLVPFHFHKFDSGPDHLRSASPHRSAAGPQPPTPLPP